jgi:hypothetical protein
MLDLSSCRGAFCMSIVATSFWRRTLFQAPSAPLQFDRPLLRWVLSGTAARNVRTLMCLIAVMAVAGKSTLACARTCFCLSGGCYQCAEALQLHDLLQGRSIKYLVTDEVLRVIQDRQLYGHERC